MAVNTERGGAIMFLFIAVALFGALGYAFLQGSRTSTTMITSEADKAATYKSQDCTNAVNMAGKRLQARGCQIAQISSDATGAVGSGPADGSCAVYHPNGGGVKGSCAPPPPPPDPCLTGPIGSVCADGAIYVGNVAWDAAYRRYIRPSDSSTSSQWKTSTTPEAWGSSSYSGWTNTDSLMALSTINYPAAALCRSLGPEWYLPGPDELALIWNNQAILNPTSIGFNMTAGYWTSNMGFPSPGTFSKSIVLNNAVVSNTSKTTNLRVRCFRHT